MKKITIQFAMPLLFLVTFANNGFSQEIINYFEVASNIAKPVTMKTGKGTYTIWGGERIDGNLGWIEAYDANGNKIVNNTPYKTEIGTNKPTIRRYRFQTLYKSTPSNTSNQSNSGSWGKDVGRKLSDVADQGFGIPQEGYPNLQIRAGFSFLMAEYVSAKAELGGISGYVLSGGYGKDLFDKQVNGHSWYAGIGYYGGNEDFDFTFDIIFISSSIFQDMFLMGELEFSYFFGGSRFGLFADLQFGGAIGQEKFAFNAGVGIAWKIFSD